MDEFPRKKNTRTHNDNRFETSFKIKPRIIIIVSLFNPMKLSGNILIHCYTLKKRKTNI